MSECPICGKPTSSYMGNERKDKLCREHANQFKEGLITLCEKCNIWHKTNEPCLCKNKVIDITKQNTCLICGEDSKGYHFCKACYSKYYKKEIILKISKCTNTEILDSQYFNNNITTEDGHIVKSKDEAIIDNYLYNHKILHRYEKEYYPNNSEKYEKPIHPDWILPNYNDLGNVYIEYWGIENSKKYEEEKEYKLQIYKEDKVTLISLYPKDITNLSEILEMKLKRCKKGEIN